MRAAFFVYELDFACRWCPAVYWDEKPRIARDQAYRYSTFWPVTTEDRDSFGEPRYGRLRAKYPPPPPVSP